ncbi:MAG: hypothetical protein H8E44_02810, partial [Planctomycetes bacterium]|nr:hypothetical protein [Planctomycetota bacterium]
IGGFDAVFIDDVKFVDAAGSPISATVGIGELGDENFHREQGQLIIENVSVTNFATYGINVEAGNRDAAGMAHPGSVITFPTENADRLVPGVVIRNNIIAGEGQVGIRYLADTAAGPTAVVPYGRIVNNTVYGSANQTGTGITIGANASPTVMNNVVAGWNTGVTDGGTGTVIASNYFQLNNNDNDIGSGALQPADTAPLFLDAAAFNFYLESGSGAIDSSLDPLQDRINYVAVKTPLGIPESAIFAPKLDVFGQLRDDDPDGNPTGGAQNIFKDRGAVERVDTIGPYSRLASPLDDNFQDQDPNPTVVHRPTGTFDEFTILLADGPGEPLPQEGSGVDPNTVPSAAVRVTQDGVELKNNIDYRFGYSTNNKTVVLTPLSGIWEPNKVYQITLDNVVIKDNARNPLRHNQTDGSTRFTIILGDVDVDYGDAPDIYDTLLASDGARHVMLPDAPLYLGDGVDADVDGRPGTLADGDDRDGVFDAGNSSLESTSFMIQVKDTDTPANNPNVLDNITEAGAANPTSFVITDQAGNTMTFEFDLDADRMDGAAAPAPIVTTPPTNEVQQVDLTGATDGTFTLAFNGSAASPAIPWNATAAGVLHYLEELATINPGDVVVSGGPLPSIPVTVEFTGQYAASGVPEMTAVASLVGSPPAAIITTTVEGAPGYATVAYFGDDLAGELARRMVRQIEAEVAAGSLVGITAQDVDGGYVRIEGAETVTVDGGDAGGLTGLFGGPLDIEVPVGFTDDGTTFTLTTGSKSVTFEFDDLKIVDDVVSDPNVEIEYHSDNDSRAAIADAIAAAIQGAVDAGRLNSMTVTTDNELVQIRGTGDDEDGLAMHSTTSPAGWFVHGVLNKNIGEPTRVIVTASGDGVVDGWIDFNRDGEFNDNNEEKILDSVSVTAGENEFFVTTPGWAATGRTYVRLRISDDGGLSPNGLAIGGEVEDHLIDILPGRPPQPVDDTYLVDEDDLLVVDDWNGQQTGGNTNDDSVLRNDNDPDAANTYGIGAVLVSPPAPSAFVEEFTFNSDGTFTFQAVKDYYGDFTFTYRPQDSRLTAKDPATVTITVQPKNDAPALGGIQDQSVDEDTDLLITGITVTDPDTGLDPNAQVQVTVSVDHGELTLAGVTGLTFPLNVDGDSSTVEDLNNDGVVDGTEVDGVAFVSITFTGTAADAQTALDGLKYRADQDYNSGDPSAVAPNVTPDIFIIQLDDNPDPKDAFGNGDDDAAPVDDPNPMLARATMSITVNPKQDAPTIPTVNQAAYTIDEDSGRHEIDTIEIFDVDDRDALTGATFDYDPDWIGQITLKAKNGIIDLGTTNGLTFLVGDSYDDPTLTFYGALDALNDALDSVFYEPDPDYNSGDPDNAPGGTNVIPGYTLVPDELTITVDDLANTDILNMDTPTANDVAAETATTTVEITVNPAQDDPTIVGPATASVNEDTVLAFADHGNEVQQLAFAGPVAGDEFTLRYGTDLIIGPIDWSTTGTTLAANLRAALDAVFGAGNTVAAAADGSSATITFQGDLANANMDELTASGLTGGGKVTPTTPTHGSGNELQLLDFGAAVGPVTLSFDGSSGVALSAPFTELQASALETNLEGIAALAGNVTVLGDSGGPFTVLYGNGLAGQNVPLLGASGGAVVSPVSNGVLVDAVQTLDLNGAAGAVTLLYDGVSSTVALVEPYDATRVLASLNDMGALIGHGTESVPSDAV